MNNYRLLVSSRKAGAIGVFEWTLESVKSHSLDGAIATTFCDRSREYNVVVEATRENVARAGSGMSLDDVRQLLDVIDAKASK